jgi:hypothetical protein
MILRYCKLYEGDFMAGKRINKAAPLSAAEKQKRHRVKQAEEKTAATAGRVEKLRELFIKEIQELSPEALMELIRLKDNPPKYRQAVTLKELSEITGLSMYELNKLEAQEVIKPIEPADPSGLTKDEISRIEQTGITKDEFLRLIKFCGQEMTLPELSKQANIPLHKLEKLDGMGLFQAA